MRGGKLGRERGIGVRYERGEKIEGQGKGGSKWEKTRGNRIEEPMKNKETGKMQTESIWETILAALQLFSIHFQVLLLECLKLSQLSI